MLSLRSRLRLWTWLPYASKNAHVPRFSTCRELTYKFALSIITCASESVRASRIKRSGKMCTQRLDFWTTMQSSKEKSLTHCERQSPTFPTCYSTCKFQQRQIHLLIGLPGDFISQQGSVQCCRVWWRRLDELNSKTRLWAQHLAISHYFPNLSLHLISPDL